MTKPRLSFTYADTEDSMGGCLCCGEYAYGVEPDARGYTCEECGKPTVYGAAELILIGHADLDGDLD